ncbi:MAG: FtsQ-type POTRA domain-containing protein [candidate division Zixibacteria bacterium]|nr:FtsQ-type POTRA domain-containing protein [candidate division Zixibacteria bacterium]
MKVNKLFLISTAVILIFSGAYIYACHSHNFNVTEIKIRGNNKITTDEIRGKAESSLGKNIFSLNLKRIEERLREEIRIKNVQVKRRLPHCILIEVEEKLPVLWISIPTNFSHSGNCGFYGLSIDQEIIPLDQKDLYNDLPIVSGIKIEMVDGKLSHTPEPFRRWSNFKVKKALEFYKTLTAIDPTSVELLAEINLEDMSNLILYLLPTVKVMMGQGDFERKWRRVRTILAGEEKIEGIICLDLRFEDQVVLTRSSKRFPSQGVDPGDQPSDKRSKNL